MDEETKQFRDRTVIGVIIIGLTLGVIIGLMFGWQRFKVYSAAQTGKAEFTRADKNRQITIVEAVARNEAAISQAQAQIKIAEGEAQAEIAKAKGVAQANVIIGEGLKGNEEYLRYLWIQNVAHGEHQVIYVPAENGLPLLEAGKR